MKRTFLSLTLLPILLLSCGALWQSDTRSPVELARTGNYKDAAAALEPMVAGGNVDPLVVESLYYSWVRSGEYAKARDKFEAWSVAKPNAAPVRLAAGRIYHLIGNYDRALTHLNAVLNSTSVGIAAQYEKATVLDDSGKRSEAEAELLGTCGDEWLTLDIVDSARGNERIPHRYRKLDSNYDSSIRLGLLRRAAPSK